MKSNHFLSRMHLVISGAMLAAAVTSTGCQVSMNGQTLPSPYYIHDDVQYFPPGPEFKLTNEGAAQKAYNAELQAQGQTPPPAQ